MKGKLKYLVLLFMVMLCAVLATLTYLSITNEEKGKVNYNNKYYNINLQISPPLITIH